jgi:hygromycin-B 7''-O-kinase
MVDSVRDDSRNLVTLNADLTSDHVLLEKRDGQWRISGIIDFGDAMAGHPLYEFAAPVLCFASGDPALARALVESYGESLTADLAHQILAWCLLHKYIRIADLLERMRLDDPESLSQALWGGQLGEHMNLRVV